MSCAAASASLGSFSSTEEDSVRAGLARLAEKMLQFVGAETGRFFRWNKPSSGGKRRHASANCCETTESNILLRNRDNILGSAFQSIIVSMCVAQIVFVRYNCNATKQANFSDRELVESMTFAGGYACMERSQSIPILGIFLWTLSLSGLSLAILAPLRLQFRWLYRWLLCWPPVAVYLRYLKHWSVLVPKEDNNPHQLQENRQPKANPQQIFVADGGESEHNEFCIHVPDFGHILGHYENFGLIPLLRRKCTRICALDCDDGRDSAGLQRMIGLAETDADTKISLGSNEFDENVLRCGLDDFYFPRFQRLEQNSIYTVPLIC